MFHQNPNRNCTQIERLVYICTQFSIQNSSSANMHLCTSNGNAQTTYTSDDMRITQIVTKINKMQFSEMDIRLYLGLRTQQSTRNAFIMRM